MLATLPLLDSTASPRTSASPAIKRRWAFVDRLLNRMGHWSVGVKLTLGFSLVLTATVAIAWVATHAMQVLQVQSSQLRALDVWQWRLAQARIAEKTFGLTGGENAAQDVRVQLNQLRAQLDRELSWEPATPALSSAVDAYRSAFNDYADAHKNLRNSRLRMQQLAELVERRFSELFIDDIDSINLALEEGHPLEDWKMGQLEQVAQLRERLVNVRSSELYFSLEPQAEHRSDWESRMTELTTALTSFSAVMENPKNGLLEEANLALVQYRQAFSSFAQGEQSADTAEELMTNLADQVGGVLQTARDEQSVVYEGILRELYLQIGIIFGLAVAAGVVATVAIRRLVVGPLQEVVALSKRISAGDLSEMPRYPERRDELGQLLESFGSMLQSLRDLVSRIGGDIDQLNTAAVDLAGMVDRTGAGVSSQRKHAEWVADAMQRMTLTAKEMRAEAEKSRDLLSDAGVSVREGNKLIRHSRDRTDELAMEIGRSASSIQLLQVESESITRVLDVIDSLAEQTNLLALNAAIEAARAGDHGRGFAVVADEVRALASRTRNSTDAIEDMIKRFTEVTRGAVSGLEKSVELSQQSSALAGDATEVFAGITQCMGAAETAGMRIADASQAQCAMAEQVDLRMSEVCVVVEQNAQDCLRLVTSSESLQQVGVGLGAAVHPFRGAVVKSSLMQ